MTYKNYFAAATGLLILLFISPLTQAQDPGFFLNEWEEKTADLPSYKIVDKTENEASFKIEVDRNEEITKVSKYIYGHNYATWDNYYGLMENSTGRQDVINLNPHAIRWPGGSLSDNYFWNTPYGQKPSDVPSTVGPWYGTSDKSWETSLNDYYDMLVQTNSTGVITVNYGYARYGTGPNPVAKAAHMAADWVRHDKGRTKFWEIGNENFGSWESGYEIDLALNQDGQPQFINGTLYGQHCKVFMDSMRTAAAEVGAEIKIGVVVFDQEEVSWSPLQSNWNELVMEQVGDIADYLSVHSYFTPYNTNSPASVILNSYTVPGEIKSILEADMEEMSKPMIPVAMTEWNIFATGSMQMVSHINGLLATMVLGEFVKNDYGMGNRWDFINGWSDGNTHAMFSTGGEPGVDPFNPRAPFYYMYFFQKYFGDRMIGLSHTGNNDIVAYASSFSSGETSLVIVNKGTSAQTTSIEIENFEPGIMYYTMTLTGDDVSFSRKVYLNGTGTDEEGGGPDNYPSIKANAMEIEGGMTVDLPAYSAVFVMVDKKGPLSYVSSIIEDDSTRVSVKFSEPIKLNAALPDIEIVADGTTALIVTGAEIDPGDNRILHVSLAEEVYRDNKLTVSYAGNDIVSLDDVVVAPFSNMAVKNLLIGDPYVITFKLTNSESGNLLEDCKVTFIDETKSTDTNGEVIFEAQPDDYTVSASKLLFKSIEDLDITILSDTLINLQLDSAYYEVTFHVEDMNTEENLSNVEIHVDGETENTTSDGNAVLNIHGGVQLIHFEKPNYTVYSEEFQLVSDTVLEVKLERSAADVKFSLRYLGQPVTSAEITLDTATLLSNAVGVCTFKSIPLNTNLNYAVVKENYYPVQGSLIVHSDTSLILQMDKSIASIDFILSAESGTIQNAFAVMEQDTSWFTAEGTGRFYGKEKNREYSYTISSDKHSDASGSIYLIKDTTIYITLIVGQELSLNNAGISVYPNPATDMIKLETYPGKIREISVYDMMGKEIFVIPYSSPVQQAQLEISMPAGIYILSVEAENRRYRSTLIIQ